MPVEATARPAGVPEQSIGRSSPPPVPPKDASEAERRFWTRYGPDLGIGPARPASVDDWLAVATCVRSLLQPTPTPTSDPMERLAVAVERMASAMEARER